MLIAAKQQIKTEIARTGIDVSLVGLWNHNLNENGKINKEKANSYYALLDTATELGAAGAEFTIDFKNSLF